LKLATLLYIKNTEGDYLLIKRAKNPNKGLLSPPGGKIITDIAETPFSCAVIEAYEECGLISNTKDWILRGIVTERSYPNIGNIMLFAFEYKNSISKIPEDSIEGSFSFVNPKNIYKLNIPETDKLYIWEFVLGSSKELFSIHIDCSKEPVKGFVETAA
jgi:8-oxo-dGTP diphosphatase